MSDYVFELYRNIALLQSYGFSLEDALGSIGIQDVNIFGIGEMGRILLGNIKNKIHICGLYDSAVKDERKIQINNNSYTVLPAPKIDNNNVVMIVTPVNSYKEILDELLQNGYERKKIFSLNIIIKLCLEKIRQEHNELKKTSISITNKQFLITGAQFYNKGAQSMLFITVDEIRKRYDNAIIWYYPLDNEKYYSKQITDKYNFLFLLDGDTKVSSLSDVEANLDGIIDISGYALASFPKWQWNVEMYIKMLKISYTYNIPMCIMPQSFGPLDFNPYLHAELRMLLSNVKVIFAREKEGCKLLKQKFDLKNVELSPDLVLQNRLLNKQNVYMKNIVDEIPNIKENAVAIIPNINNYEFMSPEKIINMYKHIIEKLQEKGKIIYILLFDKDKKCCDDIVNNIQNKSDVEIISKELDCFEYGNIIAKFEFVIASRYHSIIHSYRLAVPVIAIGWAEKYLELLKLFEQSKYNFDIRNELVINEVLDAIDDIDNNLKQNKFLINKTMLEIQKNNCFDVLNDL